MRDQKFFILTGTVMAVAIAVSLYFVTTTDGSSPEDNEDEATEEFSADVYADLYRQSIEFNGIPVNKDLKLSNYNRKGKLLMEDVRLGDLLDGNGCIALLSTNNCPGCVRNEIALLRGLDRHGKILFIYDSPIHENTAGDNIPTPIYYEFDDGELLPGLERMQETPVLLYVEDGRVTASCVVSNYSRPITTEFHKFLKKRLNDKE